MSDEAAIPPPRHVLSRKDVWQDVKKRTWVVWDIWQSRDGWHIEMLSVDPARQQPIEFITHPWPIVYKMIAERKMGKVK